MMKQAQKIDVGLHEGRPGFTIEYTDGERAHFLFNRQIARDLAQRMLMLLNDLDYLDKQMSPGVLGDGVGVHEHVRVHIMPPATGGALGIGSGDGINVSD